MDGDPRTQTILIVDDIKENIKILAELLRGEYKVRTATSGEKALEIAFSDSPPDLILLDVVMPGMDGYEVCKRLKSSPKTKNIPVVFITGRISDEDEVYGFSIGASDYITKPFNPVVVKARVRTQAELKRHRDYLEGISYIDFLTGIPNRRRFDEYLETSWNFCMRESAPLSLIMLDIDDFKRFNDTFGHQQGDECLIRIARALSAGVLRKTDLVARYGGEEFVCVLPDTPLKDAVMVAERIRLGVAGLNIPFPGAPIEEHVTVSLGVASAVPDSASSSAELVRAADEVLYRAKKNGKNSVST